MQFHSVLLALLVYFSDLQQSAKASSLLDTKSWMLPIPHQIIMTSHFDSLKEMDDATKGRVKETLELNKGFRLRWMGDTACQQYLRKFFDNDLRYFFIKTKNVHAKHRSDICRTAVLYREGGYYMDVGMELNKPLKELVNPQTTFLSVSSLKGGMQDTLIAAKPRNDVMREALDAMREWHRGPMTDQMETGPLVMHRGLMNIVEKNCPAQAARVANCGEEGMLHKPGWKKFKREMAIKPMWGRIKKPTCHLGDEHAWSCGQERFQFLTERVVDCGVVSEECPKIRRRNYLHSVHEDLRLGIFKQAPNSTKKKGSTIAGWVHHRNCTKSATCNFRYNQGYHNS